MGTQKPYEGKPCPRDERMACIKCTWYVKDGMYCKLGYVRVIEPPDDSQKHVTIKEPFSRWD